MSQSKFVPERTIDATAVASNSTELGHHLVESAYKKADAQMARAAMMCYNTAIRASTAQIAYKKHTGEPKEIDFLKG